MITENKFVADIINAVQSVAGPAPAALHAPCFLGNEWLYLKECLDSTFVSSVGKFVDQFEADLAHYTGAKHAVAIVNGTAALHLALKLAGVAMGDEVIIPALTFVATANAVMYCGATPHFADSEERTLGLDPEALHDYLQHNTEIRHEKCVNRQTGRVISALIPMHTFGHPVDIEGMLRIAHDFHLTVVEDAAESLGSTYEGQHMGTFGLMGTLSFNGNKTITTGGGGAILTNDTHLAQRAKHLSTTAKVAHRFEFVHDEVGFNYRMPNINAALGCAQLEQISDFLTAKRRLYERYHAAFAKLPGLSIVSKPSASCESNYWLQALLLDESVARARDAILYATNNAGLMTRPAWTLMHRLPIYQNCPRMALPVAESLERRLINLPSSVSLGIKALS
ncbi:MAG: LegC family aminotransferase [Legionella sp.]|nr:LegC family aminotransferase [Legionella sp.]